MTRKSLLILVICVVVTAVVAPLAVGAALTSIRNGGVQLDVPDGWAKVDRATEPAKTDPRTLLVVGTKGVRAVDSQCQVASYKVPDDGAVVVVIGWKDTYLDEAKLDLSKLRRGTFECFDGRGAVGQVTRKGHDFQISLMVGDDASAKTVRDAFAVARSFTAVR